MMERPLCEICNKNGAIIVLNGKLVCESCNRKYREKTEAFKQKMMNDLESEINGS